jgi:hypothetical protein
VFSVDIRSGDSRPQEARLSALARKRDARDASDTQLLAEQGGDRVSANGTASRTWPARTLYEQTVIDTEAPMPHYELDLDGQHRPADSNAHPLRPAGLDRRHSTLASGDQPDRGGGEPTEDAAP